MIDNVFKFSYKNIKACADKLGDWDSLSRTALANGYCKAEEENNTAKMEQYYCALLCKYWFMIGLMKQKNNHLVIEDLQFWLCEALDLAFKYKSWLNPDKEISKDKNGAEKVINRCIYSIEKRHYATSNRMKRKQEFNNYSLENLVDVYKDNTIGLGYYDSYESIDLVNLINKYISKDKILEAFILDGICFQDTYVNYNNEYHFNKHNLLTHLTNLDNEKFKKYFMNAYTISNTQYNECISFINSKNYDYIRRFVKNFLDKLKNNKEIKEILCY